MHPMIRREDTCAAQALLRNHGLPPFGYHLVGSRWCMINLDAEQWTLLRLNGIAVVG